MTRSRPRRSSNCPTSRGGCGSRSRSRAGNRYNFGAIAIDRRRTPIRRACRAQFLPLTTGHPIRAVDVEGAEANVLLRLPQEGYPFPELGLRDIVLDPDDAHRRLHTAAQSRARARASPASPPRAISPSMRRHVGVLARFRRGDLYDRRKVDDLREAMVSTRLFSTVSAEPVLTGEAAPDGTQYVNILVRQDAGPARSLDLTRRLCDRRGLPARGRVGASQPVPARRRAAHRRHRRHPGAESLRPLPPQQLGPARPRLAAPARSGRRDFEAFQGYTTRLYGLVSRESTPIWQKRWTYAYGAELLATNENRDGNRQGVAVRRLFHRRADRAARLRPLEQPARSDPRLPPARAGQSRSLARATARTSTSAT